ncbi:MAG: DUF4230 domain-containing protein [Candidatus Promineifilaceae bacterium]|nr:DUF4230 domain-containing protein [Candidatus Promineifilaceae bacterium]
MEEKTEKPAETNEQDDTKMAPLDQRTGGSNWLRNLAYISVILFFAVLSFLAIMFAVGLNKTNEAVVEPVSNLVRQLTLPVTPVILPNPATIVKEINDLARLETASFEFEKIITAETGQDVFWGALGETMIFVAHGKIYAGVDFSEMAVDDLQVYDPDTVYVYLPEAKIFEDIPVLDNEKSFVADRDTGILTRADPQLESQVRVAAEEAIREAADESEILGRANENAQVFMANFLNGLGFENVIFTDGPPRPAPPFEQEVPKGFVVTPQAP